MTDYDPDAPETLSDFVDRQMRRGSHTFIPSGLTKEERAPYGESLNEAWERLEKEKAERRKKREQELKEHERMVAQLKTQIEREKERIRRDAERLQREQQRKLEQKAERERRDPTPQVQPAATIPKIPFEIRDQHIFIPGMTRHGKSTQFFHMILDDINSGHGVALLDPIKGDLITEILPYIPTSRLKDCIYLDLANPIPLDVMRPTPNPEELVSDIKALVLKGDTTLKRAEPILTRLIYALLAIPDSKFTDIEDVFTLPGRKKWFLDGVKQLDERTVAYWNEWPRTQRLNPSFRG